MRACFILVIIFLVHSKLVAQCTGSINSYPSAQDFETSNGGWTAGGTASDWAYGTPAKTIIKGAASGTKCWIAGGLTASSYNNGENSWLMSPCYDMSNLTTPLVSFKVFWETERRWDGASLDYSTDGGNTWVRAGSVNDTTDCYTANWFNFSTINNVGEGWSGTIKPTNGSCIGGGGVGQWVEAKHQFLNLAGKPSVRFRFVFVAGTTCNNFEGFAIDDFTVKNTPPPSADYNYTCVANSTVAFQAASDCATNFQWNFGDPSSGTNNNATGKNANHIFSAPGSYQVTLTLNNANGQQMQAVKTVTVLGGSIAINTPIYCYGQQSGGLTASGNGGTGSYSYYWNNQPFNVGPTISNLGAGTYTVSIENGDACPANAAVVLSSPLPLSHTVSIINATCGKANGSATIKETGGTFPYYFTWTPTGGVDSFSNNLPAGNYAVYIKDENQCTDTVNFAIQDINSLQLSFDSSKNVSCYGGSDGMATVNASGGTGGFTYAWTPYGGVGSTARNLQAGTYAVNVTDGGGCTGNLSITISQPPKLSINLGDDGIICPGAGLVITPGNFAGYIWQDSSTNAGYTVNKGGKYWVTVTTQAGCTASDTIFFKEECNNIVFPSAFTPNGDYRNDIFKPLGTLSALSDYRLLVYNRWGQVIFETNDPYKGWNGKVNNIDQGIGTYIWVASFSFNHQPKSLMKGSLVLLR